jgi:hypothetical protein
MGVLSHSRDPLSCVHAMVVDAKFDPAELDQDIMSRRKDQWEAPLSSSGSDW